MSEPRDPFEFNFGLDFKTSAERVTAEREHRLQAAERVLPFYHAFLDDALRGILPNDLILIGALTGAGKTELARSIAAANAQRGRHVHYFALEAEPYEIERRSKFAIIASLVARHRICIPGGLNYADWYTGKAEPYLRADDNHPDVDAEADRFFADKFKTLHTYYRGSSFGTAEIQRLFSAINTQTDLVVLDHLHYVDIDDDNENRGFKKAMKMIRDVALGMGKPVILVAHIRKRDTRIRGLVPTIDDVHGSSDIAKICTRAILLAPASENSLEDSSCVLTGAGTYFAIPKDRISGALRQVALCDFDQQEKRYADYYTLGYPSRSGERFEPLRGLRQPSWAKRHRAALDDQPQPHWQS